MEDSLPYFDRLQVLVPGLDPSKVEHNADGLNNDVLIVDGRRVFRFPKSERARLELEKEVRILSVVQRYVDTPTPVFDQMDDLCVAYNYIPGEPLSRDYPDSERGDTSPSCLALRNIPAPAPLHSFQRAQI